jgi:iron(III) transport system substrate-binding protein
VNQERKGLSRRTLLGAAGVTLLTAAGCGSSSGGGGSSSAGAADSIASVKGLKGDERIAKLKSMASSEGNALTLWTSLNKEQATPLMAAFTKDTGVKVDLYINDADSLLQKGLQELQAKKFSPDIYENHGVDIIPLGKMGAFVDYESPFREGLVGEASRYSYWTAIRGTTRVVSWNTNLVSDADRPRTWQDLAAPRFHGAVVFDARPEGDWLMTLWGYLSKKGMSDDELTALFSKMYDGAGLAKGNSTRGQLLAAGQYKVDSTTYSYLIDALIKKGAPVAWQPAVQPIITDTAGAAISKTARHPAASMLFVDWVISSGQDTVASMLDPMRSDLEEKKFHGIERIFVNADQYLAEQKKWDDLDMKFQQASKASS